MAVICTFRTSKQEHFLTESPSGKSACVHGHECSGVAALRFLLMCTVSKMKRRQQTMLSFFSTAEKSRRKTDDSNFRIELRNITCCSSSESANKTIQPTVSMAVATFAWCMRGQSSLWNVTHYDSAKCIFNERLKEVLTTKPFYNASVQNFRQMNCELGQIDVEKNETADFVILHISKRKSPYGNITLMPFIYL